APAADRRLHHKLARSVEREGVGRHKGLEDAKQSAGKSRVRGGNHECGKLVAVNVVTESRGARRIVSYGVENDPYRRAHDAERDTDGGKKAQRKKLIQRPAVGKWQGGKSEIKARHGHAGQAVLTAGPFGQWIEFDKVEHLRNRYGDHRKIDSGAAQGDKPDQIAGDRGGDHANDKGCRHVAEACACQKIGSDNATGAVESRLTER